MLQCNHSEGEGAEHGEHKPAKRADESIHGFLPKLNPVAAINDVSEIFLICALSSLARWCADKCLGNGKQEIINKLLPCHVFKKRKISLPFLEHCLSRCIAQACSGSDSCGCRSIQGLSIPKTNRSWDSSGL